MPTTSINLDDESTWPEKLMLMLDEHALLLEKYEAEEQRIELLCEQDRVLRSRPPENPYRHPRERFLRAVEEFLRDTSLFGYHCTRLHEEEIANILKVGLIPLNAEFVDKRISKLQEMGELSTTIATKLRNYNFAKQKTSPADRLGMIWIILTSSFLRSEDACGVSEFFRSWGGEAIYAAHEGNSDISSKLQDIGTPCIVEVALAVDSIQINGSIGEILLYGFLHRRNVRTTDDPVVHGYVRTAIEAEQIMRIIKRSDKDFERLTACSQWYLPLK